MSKRLLLLIVDDDESLRDAMCELLSAEFITVGVWNGQEALTFLASQRPDLILLDLMMPVMNGWDFRRAQLADPALADIPVIVMSASRDLDKVDIPCIKKPFDLDKLRAVIRQVLGDLVDEPEK